MTTEHPPLFSAIWNRDLEAFEKELANGADVNARDTSDSWSALHWCCSKTHVDPQFLKMCKLLIASGADVNATNAEYVSPFHACIAACNVSTWTIGVE